MINIWRQYEYGRYKETYKVLRSDITRKEWIKNWKENVCWTSYWDVDIVNIEKLVSEYCTKNNLWFDINGGWLDVVSNRYHYNRIMSIIYDILDEDETE